MADPRACDPRLVPLTGERRVREVEPSGEASSIAEVVPLTNGAPINVRASADRGGH